MKSWPNALYGSSEVSVEPEKAALNRSQNGSALEGPQYGDESPSDNTQLDSSVQVSPPSSTEKELDPPHLEGPPMLIIGQAFPPARQWEWGGSGGER